MRINRPVTGVSLRIDQVLPYYRESEDLFARNYSGNTLGANADRQDWQQLIDILGARLGSKMIYYVRPEVDHRPERAWRCNSWEHNCRESDSVGSRQWKRSRKLEIPVPPRPLWLLDKPRKIPRQRYTLHQAGETERIESGWWDGSDLRRDYYIAATPSGSKCWVFRDVNGTSDFYMHGLFG